MSLPISREEAVKHLVLLGWPKEAAEKEVDGWRPQLECGCRTVDRWVQLSCSLWFCPYCGQLYEPVSVA